TTTSVPRARTRGLSMPCSSWVLCLAERMPELRESGPGSCLDGSEWLIQLHRHFTIRQLAEERPFDGLALRWRENFQGLAHDTGLFPDIQDLLGITRRGRGRRAVDSAVHALLPLFEPQPVDRSRARLVHDPSDDRSARGVVRRCSSPDVM